jgi:FtsH-binding integral membrane protein
MKARALGRGAVKGLGGSVLAAGVGAVGYAVHGLSSKITAPNGDMSKYPSRFWIPSVAMLVVGHVMRRKPKTVLAGAALCGAAGFSIAEGATLAYTIKSNAKAQAAAGGTSGLAPDGYSETGAVFGETGAVYGETVGARMTPGETVGSIMNDEQNAYMNL